MSDLPLLPILFPGESPVAAASQRKARVVAVIVLLFLLSIEEENEDCCTASLFPELIAIIFIWVFRAGECRIPQSPGR